MPDRTRRSGSSAVAEMKTFPCPPTVALQPKAGAELRLLRQARRLWLQENCGEWEEAGRKCSPCNSSGTQECRTNRTLYSRREHREDRAEDYVMRDEKN